MQTFYFNQASTYLLAIFQNLFTSKLGKIISNGRWTPSFTLFPYQLFPKTRQIATAALTNLTIHHHQNKPKQICEKRACDVIYPTMQKFSHATGKAVFPLRKGIGSPPPPENG